MNIKIAATILVSCLVISGVYAYFTMNQNVENDMSTDFIASSTIPATIEQAPANQKPKTSMSNEKKELQPAMVHTFTSSAHSYRPLTKDESVSLKGAVQTKLDIFLSKDVQAIRDVLGRSATEEVRNKIQAMSDSDVLGIAKKNTFYLETLLQIWDDPSRGTIVIKQDTDSSPIEMLVRDPEEPDPEIGTKFTFAFVNGVWILQ